MSVLSKSSLWSAHRDGYAMLGPQAWAPGAVPLQATSNPLIADLYARLIAAACRDLGCPLTVLEVGAGSGRFTFYLLRALERHGAASCPVVVTDLVEANRTMWATHPALAPFLADGRLQIAPLDTRHPDPLPIPAGRPAVVIANYLFDSIEQDALRLRGGRLRALHYTLAEEGPLDARVLLCTPRRHVPYADPRWNHILADHTTRLEDAVFLFPTAALSFLDRMLIHTEQQLLVLSTDKGYQAPTQLEGRAEDGLIYHGDVLSAPVNYMAIAHFLEQVGGFSRFAERWSGLVQTMLGVVGWSPDALPQLWCASEENLSVTAPADSLALLAAARSAQSAETFLVLLRCSRWDPAVLLVGVDRLVEQIDGLPGWLKRELREALPRVWANHYPLPGHHTDLPFAIGRLYQALDRPRMAIAMYQVSTALGDHPATRLNIAVCAMRLGENRMAQRSLEAALVLAPKMAEAHHLLRQLATA